MNIDIDRAALLSLSLAKRWRDQHIVLLSQKLDQNYYPFQWHPEITNQQRADLFVSMMEKASLRLLDFLINDETMHPLAVKKMALDNTLFQSLFEVNFCDVAQNEGFTYQTFERPNYNIVSFGGHNDVFDSHVVTPEGFALCCCKVLEMDLQRVASFLKQLQDVSFSDKSKPLKP